MGKNVINNTPEVNENTFNLGGSNPSNSNDVGVGAGMDDGGDTFDLSGVDEDRKFEVLPKGNYTAVVESMEFGPSKNNNPMITAVYSLTDPEHENRKVYDYMVLGGDGAEFGKAKIKKFLIRVCPEVDVSHFNAKQFCESGTGVGRECRITLKIQTQKQGEYKGEKRNQVSDILAPESAMGSFL